MNVEILERPANSAAKILLQPGETCTAEGGSMIAMSGDMKIETKINKAQKGAMGMLKGFARTLGGEGIFMNHYTAPSGGGELYLSTNLPGDMQEIHLDGTSGWNVQKGSFVAHSSSIAMNISWGGFKNVFSGENMIWLKLSGSGLIVINAFGALYPVDVDGEYIVDTGNIAAFEDSLEFSLSKAGKSWVSSFMGGEGLVCRFKGKGRVWCQTHADKNFGVKLTPHLIEKKK